HPGVPLQSGRQQDRRETVLRRALLIALLPIAAAGRTADIDAFQSALLDLHNRERASLDERPLVWSDALARGAAAWAKHLAETARFEHSTPEQRDGEGENLWQGTAGFYGPERMVGDWLAEKRDFAPGIFPVVARDGNPRAVGHYTQIVWRATAKVGCAM